MGDANVEGASGIGRRDVIKRGAFVVGAATLWSTPVVQTLGQRPAAAGTYDGLTQCDGQPLRLMFRYVPTRGCNFDNLWYSSPNPPVGGYICDDLSDCTQPAQITARNTSGAGEQVTFPSVSPGSTFTVSELHPNGKVGANMEFTITACGKTQQFEIHTSCSKDLAVNFAWGSLVLVGIYND